MVDITSATNGIPKNIVATAIDAASNMAQSALSDATGFMKNQGMSVNDFKVPELDFGSILFDQIEMPSDPPYPNVLSAYASYNYIFTLSVIDDYSLNYPNETYKRGQLGQIILKSGSLDASNRVVIKDFGVFEFYIEDVEMESVVGFQATSGNTNVATLRFKVIEPYSMGMFFHALSAAADHVGHKNYTSAVYL